MKSIYLFPIIATCLFYFMNLYVYKSLKSRLLSYDKFKKFSFLPYSLLVILTILDALYFISVASWGIMFREYFYKICVYSMAISIGLFFICLFFDILSVSLQTIKFSQSRRKFIKFAFDITFIIIGFLYFFKGFFNAVKTPKINEVEIKLKNLEKELNLAVISDVHLGEFLKKDFLQEIVNQINSISHDAVLIVGDMFDIKADEVGDMLEPLKKLSKPIFFVTGNHEYYRGADDLIKVLQNNGVMVLQNESVELESINLIGVHDLSGAKLNYLPPNLQKALSGVNSQKPKVLMAHQPKFINESVDDEVDLCICGHTHAGQIFPFSLLVILDQKYLHGLYDDGKKQIYVSSGAGFWGPPMRFLAPNEIALLKLRKA